jgi:uncharacterized protein (TIGR00255 family)
MTGHGEAQIQSGGVCAAAEVRTVNNRFLKTQVRTTEGYGSLERQIEGLVRGAIRRGSVSVTVRVDREPSPDDYRLNEVVLNSYRSQLEAVCEQAALPYSVSLDSLLTLPGVVTESGVQHGNAEKDWPLVEQALTAALEHLAQMRQEEGAAMARDLHANCQTIARELERIGERAPLVASAYQQRLTERLNTLLAEYEVAVQPADIVREVGVFADRADISEEMVRLRSHLEQFETIARAEESAGRKLEFVIQEMHRETNTIGSKANDAEIARHVVEIKTCIERMREMIQNIE